MTEWDVNTSLPCNPLILTKTGKVSMKEVTPPLYSTSRSQPLIRLIPNKCSLPGGFRLYPLSVIILLL